MTAGRAISAAQRDEIEVRYGNERTADLAKRLGLHPYTVTRLARELGIVLTPRQRWRMRSPYARGR